MATPTLNVVGTAPALVTIASRADRAGKTIGHVGAGRGRVTDDHDHELVTCEPGEEILRAQCAGTSGGDDLEHLVPGRVPELVVDRLEVVDVGHDDRHRFVVGVRGGDEPRRHLEELAAVGKPGERIGVSEAAELRDEPLVVALHGQLAGDDDDREPQRPEHQQRDPPAHVARGLLHDQHQADDDREVRQLAHPGRRLRGLLPGSAATARRLSQCRERERREGTHPERVRQRPRSIAVGELEARVDDVGNREQHRPAGEQPQGRRPVASDPPAHQDARATPRTRITSPTGYASESATSRDPCVPRTVGSTTRYHTTIRVTSMTVARSSANASFSFGANGRTGSWTSPANTNA